MNDQPPSSLLAWQLGQVEERADLNLRAMARLMAQTRTSLLQHGITLSDEALVQMVSRGLELALMYDVSVVEIDEDEDDG